ncbi:hypothetical protein FHL15_009434 [Xylaria flabelliformis]|uniref:Uncharacterized protein n=1 Tax=Xylaria flabelliformis TaxID=2512241 RepID=A0A553HNZ6_9PEZI|nr:hypothetical protein FHL15_009434 [Xylaria flabelliformis]
MGSPYQGSASAGAVASAGAGAVASASASAGVGYDPQLSLSSQMPTSIPPLTTIFTPPPECKTPFAFDGSCDNDFECNGSYMPFLYLPASENPRGTSIQCYPEITTYNDGFVDAVYDYSPGLFCPDGVFTSMIDKTLLSNIGQWKDNSASIVSTTSFSAADRMTLYPSAVPVYLTNARSGTFNNVPSQSITSTSGESSTIGTSMSVEVSSKTSTSNSPKCRRDNCQTTTTTQPSTGGGSTTAANPLGSNESKPTNQNNLKIGVGVGVGVGGAVALTLLALGFMLLRRYHRKRLLSHPQVIYSPPTKPNGNGGGEQDVQQLYQEKPPSELPVAESWIELEGTQAEDRGTGIYVWKPELEGTAGVLGAKGVYVRRKSELEAKYTGNAAPVTGAVVYAESPVVGASFANPRYPAPTVIQMYT